MLRPWQIFTLLFGFFCTIVRYFNHLLMTIIICIAFGGVAEVVSKYLYVWKKPSVGICVQEKEVKVDNKIIDDETDEELEEKYANIEVNFDESESEEEEYVPKENNQTSVQNVRSKSFDAVHWIANHHQEEYNDRFDNVVDVQHPLDKYVESIGYENEVFFENTKETFEDIHVSRGKSFIQDNYMFPEDNRDIDINLADPAVMAAATKIQSVFKGFRVRRKALQKNS